MKQFPKGVRIVEGSSFDNWSNKNKMKQQYKALYILGAIAVVLKMIINVSEAEVLAATGLLLSIVGTIILGVGITIARNIFKEENKSLFESEAEARDFDVRR